MTNEEIIDQAMKHVDDVLKTYRDENRTMRDGDIRVLCYVIANSVLEKNNAKTIRDKGIDEHYKNQKGNLPYPHF